MRKPRLVAVLIRVHVHRFVLEREQEAALRCCDLRLPASSSSSRESRSTSKCLPHLYLRSLPAYIAPRNSPAQKSRRANTVHSTVNDRKQARLTAMLLETRMLAVCDLTNFHVVDRLVHVAQRSQRVGLKVELEFRVLDQPIRELDAREAAAPESSHEHEGDRS